MRPFGGDIYRPTGELCRVRREAFFVDFRDPVKAEMKKIEVLNKIIPLVLSGKYLLLPRENALLYSLHGEDQVGY
jgi:hypothetical protein